MANSTKIEWASKVWNPLAGCSLASPGCTNCYAMKMAGRLEAMGMPQYQGTTQRSKARFVWTGQVNAAPESILTAPLRQKKPTDYFVNSMSDLFHPAVPDALIDRVFAVMALCPQHVFKILTKRPDRMRAYISDDRTQGRIARVIIDWLLDKVIACREPWPVRSIGDIDEPTDLALKQWPLPNVWKGTSVEDQHRADERIPHLLATPAALRFLSMEPLLGPVDLTRVQRFPETRKEFINAIEGKMWTDQTGLPNPDPRWARRRKRTRRAADAPGLGAVPARSMRRRRRPVFLQAMGRMGRGPWPASNRQRPDFRRQYGMRRACR